VIGKLVYFAPLVARSFGSASGGLGGGAFL
jgi:hypothetical protein